MTLFHPGVEVFAAVVRKRRDPSCTFLGMPQPPCRCTLPGNDVLVLAMEARDLSRIESGPHDLVCLPRKLAAGAGAPACVLLATHS